MTGPSRYTVSKAVIEQRRNAKLQHGTRSSTVMVPLTRNVKQSVLKRLGLRQSELSWAAREQLDMYARGKAKLQALDRYFEATPIVDEDGRSPYALREYWAAYRAVLKALDGLRRTIEVLAREDERYDRALARLTAEGQRVREEHGS